MVKFRLSLYLSVHTECLRNPFWDVHVSFVALCLGMTQDPNEEQEGGGRWRRRGGGLGSSRPSFVSNTGGSKRKRPNMSCFHSPCNSPSDCYYTAIYYFTAVLGCWMWGVNYMNKLETRRAMKTVQHKSHPSHFWLTPWQTIDATSCVFMQQTKTTPFYKGKLNLPKLYVTWYSSPTTLCKTR